IPSLKASNPVSDLNKRINDIILSLTRSSYFDAPSNTSFTFDSLANQIRNSLLSPKTFGVLARYLGSAETAIKRGNIRELNRRSAKEATAKLFNPSDPLTGLNNEFAYWAVSCVDLSFANADNSASFAQQVVDQVAINPL